MKFVEQVDTNEKRSKLFRWIWLRGRPDKKFIDPDDFKNVEPK